MPICDDESSDVGLLSDGGEKTVSLRCHTPLAYTQWVDVGHVTARREEYDKSEPNDLGPDYSSWTIARAYEDLPIVSRSEDGTLQPGGPEVNADDYVSHMTVRPYRL